MGLRESTGRYGESTERALGLFVRLTRCFNAVSEHARRDIDSHGLSVSEFAVLELLYHRGPTPLGEIAQRILLTTGSITYVIDQLVSMGLVERAPCPQDRRRYYAVLTPAGTQKISEIFPTHAEEIRRTMSALTEDEQEALTRLLKKLGKSAAAGLEEGAAHTSLTNDDSIPE
jgi:MarR family 2-MHQ and catechol resistance regulon transcriptional repressor